LRIGLASVAFLSLAAALLAAELDERVVDNPRFEREGGLYRQYCGACHGPRGMGDGVVAPLMDPRPIDLTGIKAIFGGSFPKYLVVLTVDGRDTVRAHGESQMPVWGEVFAEEFIPDPAARAKARGKVMEIVDYIENIQR
jgi:mono/diheme cytochrome c family protein